MYGYVLSDPINFVDPMGLERTTPEGYKEGQPGNTFGTNVFNTICMVTGKCDQIPPDPAPFAQQMGRKTFDLFHQPPPSPPLPPFLPPPYTPKTYTPPNNSCGG